MILPLGDDNSDRRRTPVITYLFIVMNVAVFVLFQNLGTDFAFTAAFAAVPQEILTGEDLVTPDRQLRDAATGRTFRVPGLAQTPVPVYLTLLTSMFMHGSLMHLLGNMLYLFIFGDNIEDRLGGPRYIGYYLGTGVAAALAHVALSAATQTGLAIPMVGASGAISGLLGGYLLLFPERRVRVLLFRFITQVPAVVVIGLWFVFQVINGLGYLGGRGDGVAYAAHVGGFIAGLGSVRLLDAGARR